MACTKAMGVAATAPCRGAAGRCEGRDGVYMAWQLLQPRWPHRGWPAAYPAPLGRACRGCAPGTCSTRRPPRMTDDRSAPPSPPRLAVSHARGATDTPLIEQTIGDFFAAMAQR